MRSLGRRSSIRLCWPQKLQVREDAVRNPPHVAPDREPTSRPMQVHSERPRRRTATTTYARRSQELATHPDVRSFALLVARPLPPPDEPRSDLLLLATFPAVSRRLGLLLLPAFSLSSFGLLSLPASPLGPFSTLTLGLFARSLLPLPALALISLRLLLLPASPFSLVLDGPARGAGALPVQPVPGEPAQPVVDARVRPELSLDLPSSVALVVAVTVAEPLVRPPNCLEDPLGSLVSGVLVGVVLLRQADGTPPGSRRASLPARGRGLRTDRRPAVPFRPTSVSAADSQGTAG